MKIAITFYLTDKNSPIETLDYILQLINFIDNCKKLNISVQMLLLNSKEEIFRILLNKNIFLVKELKEVFEYIETSGKIHKDLKYQKIIRKMKDPGEIGSFIEFFNLYFWSAKKFKGLVTHIDISINKIPRTIKNGIVIDKVRCKNKLARVRKKHYKGYKYSQVYFTWAVFLSESNWNLYEKIFKEFFGTRVPKNSKLKKNEIKTINRFRYEIFKKNPKNLIFFRKIKKVKYNYCGSNKNANEKTASQLIHWDSFFKEGKNYEAPDVKKIINKNSRWFNTLFRDN